MGTAFDVCCMLYFQVIQLYILASSLANIHKSECLFSQRMHAVKHIQHTPAMVEINANEANLWAGIIKE